MIEQAINYVASWLKGKLVSERVRERIADLVESELHKATNEGIALGIERFLDGDKAIGWNSNQHVIEWTNGEEQEEEQKEDEGLLTDEGDFLSQEEADVIVELAEKEMGGKCIRLGTLANSQGRKKDHISAAMQAAGYEVGESKPQWVKPPASAVKPPAVPAPASV